MNSKRIAENGNKVTFLLAESRLQAIISSFLVNESGNKAILMMQNMNPNISAPLSFTILGIERVNKNS